jgi:hypothetical protein
MQYLSWAFNLRALPEQKLLAIYVAGVVNQDGFVLIDEETAARWCGFVSPARNIPRLHHVGAFLQDIPGLKFEYRDCGKISVEITL